LFLMWPLLFSLTAASIPVIIHLLHRQRTKPVRWGAMQFLLETPLQMKRRKKVDHWLLMLLRVLGLAALAFLLARPLLIHGQYNPLASRLPVDVAVVMDHSLSMGRHAGQQTLFAQGVGVADQVGNLLQPSDSLSIVLAEHHPRVLTPLPVGVGEVPRVREQLHQLPVGLSDCSIPDAVQTAREVISRGRNVRKLILVVSDGQSTSWHAEDDSAWRLAAGAERAGAGRDLEIHQVQLKPDTTESDISIGQIDVAPSLVGVGQPTQITATISNSGPKDFGPLGVRLMVNGKPIEPAAQLTGLASGQSTTIRFDHTFDAAGSNWIKVYCDAADALEADNQAVAAVHVWEKIPVLIIDGQLTSSGGFRSSQFLQSAMQPVDRTLESGTLVQPRVVGVAQSGEMKLDDYFAVIVNDCPQLPSAVQDKLVDYARSGHGVWIILGQRTDPSFISQELGRAGIFTASLKDPKPHGETTPQSTDLKDPRNPMVSLVASAQRDAFSGALAAKWWSLQASDPDAAVVLASTTGDPLVLERPMGRNGGRIVVWCTSVDGEWNNWPLMPNFVPLVNETIYHLSSGQTRGLDNRALHAGEPLIWTGSTAHPPQAIDVTLPDGTIDGNRSPTLANGRYEFRYNDASLPGLYALHFTPTEIKPQPIYYGVGIDPKELDQRSLSANDQKRLADAGFLDDDHAVSTDDLSAIIRRENRGTDLWKWLAMFVMLNLLAETYLTYRLIRVQKSVSVAAAMGPNV
jgi:aerotolerance regulator-like protein/VWA domain-containing protein/CARDB protein